MANLYADENFDYGAVVELRLLGHDVLRAQAAGQANQGIPLLTATQWELIEEAAKPLQAAFNELVRQAAWGEVKHS